MRNLPAVLVLSMLFAAGLPAQEYGAIQGRVTDPDGNAVEAVVIELEHSHARTVTGPDGRYTVPRAQPGRTRVRAGKLGFETAQMVVGVATGQTAQADFVLSRFPHGRGLGVLVAPRNVTLGADTIVPAPAAPPATMSQLLTARSPSVIVRASSGTLGTGSRIYLRGVSSLNYRATPLVVVDGVRYVSEPGALLIPVGGQTPSRLDDLDPDEVEEVVVLPGAAAAAKYGPEGANGVLEVRTRRAGAAMLRVGGFAELGVRSDPADLPLAWSRVGIDSESGRTIYCTLTQESLGQCAPYADSLRSIRNGGSLRRGSHRRARVTAEGGAGWGRLRGTADLGMTDGVRAKEGWERRRFHLAGILQPLRGVEVDASLLRAEADLDLPQGDNSALGYQYPLVAFGPGDQRSVPDWVPPVSQAAGHTTAAARVGWQARPWLRLGARGGIDRSTRDDLWHLVPPSSSDSARAEGDQVWTRRTVAVGATASTRLAGVGSVSSLEVERWSDRRFEHLFSRDGGLEQETERFRRTRAVAVSLSQRLDAGRLGAGGHLRRDHVQPDDEALWSGSLSAYAVPLARRRGPLDELRVRAAYGWIRRPLPQEFTPGCADGPGCITRPDGARSREAEGGVDLRAGRATLALTGYRRLTEEPLWALSAGEGSYTIRNSGMEAALRVALPSRRGVQADVELLGWTNRNRVEELDGPPIAFNLFNQTIREGMPLGAYYGRTILSVTDVNGDGIITGVCPGNAQCDVQLDTARFLGAALPDHGLTLGVRLRAGDRVTLSARLDHQGGNKLLNRTALYQCAALQTCQPALDPASTLEDQARVQAARRGTPVGFLEDGGFTRLREVAVTVAAPPSLLRLTGAQTLDLVVSGRNLLTWTDYSGLDPEVNFTGSADPISSGEWLTQPNPRVWTVRLVVNP